MKFTATWTMALRALRRNPLRTGLTMLGIIIGVGAVIAMVAIAITGLLTIYVKQRGGLHSKKRHKGVFIYQGLYVH